MLKLSLPVAACAIVALSGCNKSHSGGQGPKQIVADGTTYDFPFGTSARASATR
jgi:hypothetical protein